MLFVNGDTVDTGAIYDVYWAQNSDPSTDEMASFTYTSFL